MYARLSAAIAVLATAGLLSACGPAPETPTPAEAVIVGPTPAEARRAARRFEALRSDFMPWYFEAQPVRSTELGLAEHARRFPDVSRTGIQGRIDGYLEWLARLDEIPFTHLEGGLQYDYGLLEYALRAELMELEETRSWVRDPRYYTGLVRRGLAGILDGGIEDAERVPALRARMDSAPALLRMARENLGSPPELWTDLAIEDSDRLIAFLTTDLADAMAAAGEGTTPAALPTELVGPRDRLITALEGHRAWLADELRPRSTGDFRLGRFLLERRLLYEEHIALSADELDRINERAIRELTGRVAAIAAEIDPDRTPREIMDSIVGDQPAVDSLLPLARQLTAALGAWVEAGAIAPVPEHELPGVRVAPLYATGDVATLAGPGPFGSGPFYVQLILPRAEWSAERQAQHMAWFGYGNLLAMAAHQTFPGHLVERLHRHRHESDIRKVFAPRSWTEGWAHYAEQLLDEAGYTAGDPALRLAQLRRALERHARWYAALHLHAYDASVDEVVERFSEIAYLPAIPARHEVVRATWDPTYLYDALGRLQINELRRDYAQYLEEKGETLALEEFHDTLLSLQLPLTLAREALIPPPSSEPGRLQLIPPRR